VTAPAGQPTPKGDDWVMSQLWRDLLFVHWRVPPESLRERLPAELEPDTFDGSAWVGAVAFDMAEIEWRKVVGWPGALHWITSAIDRLPFTPDLFEFPELNLRTYVTHDSSPGVYFLSIDAPSRYNSWMARRVFGLPYFFAELEMEPTLAGTYFSSRRRDGSGATLTASFAPDGEQRQPDPGSLEQFLLERYAMFAPGPLNSMLTVELWHEPWRVASAAAELDARPLLSTMGVEVNGAQPDSVLHVDRMRSLFWAPRRLG
jgi:uncharacterized protein YqjF (DUF2071 family)